MGLTQDQEFSEPVIGKLQDSSCSILKQSKCNFPVVNVDDLSNDQHYQNVILFSYRLVITTSRSISDELGRLVMSLSITLANHWH